MLQLYCFFVSAPMNALLNSYDLLLTKLTSWINSAVTLLPNIVVAFVVFFIFTRIAKVAYYGTHRGCEQVTKSKNLQHLAGMLIKIIVLIVGFSVTMSVLGLDKAVNSMLAGAGILGLAVGFAFQDFFANMLAGVLVSLESPFDVGDSIEVAGQRGTVRKINFRTTEIRLPEGPLLLLPNKELMQNKLINHSSQGLYRVTVSVGVSYDDDLQLVEKLLRIELEKLHKAKSKTVDIYFTRFGDSSIDVLGRFWIKYQRHADIRKHRSTAIVAIKAAFDAAGVTIPYPIRVEMQAK